MLAFGVTTVRVLVCGIATQQILISTVAGSLRPTGWKETRADKSRCGQVQEVAVTDAQLRWVVGGVGKPLLGEPVVDGCSVINTDASGDVSLFDIRDGREEWRTPRDYALCPVGIASAVAVGQAELYVGLPGDAGVASAWSAARIIRSAIGAYTSDTGQPPSGPDLLNDLVPQYLSAMPPNELLGRPMTYAAVPRPGDYTYRSNSAPAGYSIGIWWVDGGVVPDVEPCAQVSAWPVSIERGGEFRSTSRVNGQSLWRQIGRNPSGHAYPSVLRRGVLWTSEEISSTAPEFPSHGRLVVIDSAGATVVERVTWSPPRGSAAVNVTEDLIVLAHGAAPYAAFFNSVLSSLGSAVEQYLVDRGTLPPDGDLAPSLVPRYLACLPEHPLGGRRIAWSRQPSPGDFDFKSSGSSYQLIMWGEDATPIASFENGVMTVPASDGNSGVVAFDDSLTSKWRLSLGVGSGDVTPIALEGGDTAFVGSELGVVYALRLSDGSSRWQVDLKARLIEAPAIRPDGSIVFYSEEGKLFVLSPGGAVLATVVIGAAPSGPPTATGDNRVYAAGEDGNLRLIEADGTLVRTIDLSEGGRIALSTGVVQANGMLFVGRGDGSLVALSSPVWSDVPGDLGNTLMLVRERDDVVFESTVALACSYNVRASGSAEVRAGDPLIVQAPPGQPRDSGAVSRGPSLRFYRVFGVSCCSGVQGPG